MPNNVIGATQLADVLLGKSSAGPLIPPTYNPATLNGSGGTLAAATYWYRFTAVSAAGEGLPSGEASVTTSGSTSQVTWTGTAPIGATSIKVYGRTNGAELLMATVAVTGGQAWTWTDTGAITPAGALPTVDASGNSGEVVIYTCPANTYVKLTACTFSNESATAAAVGCALSIVPSGGSAGVGTGTREAGPFTLRAGRHRDDFRLGHVLSPGDFVTALLPHNLVTVRLSGKLLVHA